MKRQLKNFPHLRQQKQGPCFCEIRCLQRPVGHEPMLRARSLSSIQMQQACDEGDPHPFALCSHRHIPTVQLADIGGMSCKEHLRPLFLEHVENDFAVWSCEQGKHPTAQSTTTWSLALRVAQDSARCTLWIFHGVLLAGGWCCSCHARPPGCGKGPPDP